MGARLDNNRVGGSDIELDITVEEDEGIFLTLNAEDPETMEPVFDYIATDAAEIETFFRLVDEAKAEYARLKERLAQPVPDMKKTKPQA